MDNLSFKNIISIKFSNGSRFFDEKGPTSSVYHGFSLKIAQGRKPGTRYGKCSPLVALSLIFSTPLQKPKGSASVPLQKFLARAGTLKHAPKPIKVSLQW
jgi:hypothetical protein